MDRFAINESRMLYFHRVVLDEARRTPSLIVRARATLGGMRDRRPDTHGVWAEWESLLDGSIEELAAVVLAPSARAGLLRANSPIIEGLAPEERNALWQRVGLQQFVAYFMAAAEDLALTAEEQAAIASVSVEVVEGWREEPPLTITSGSLEALKLIVGLRHALALLYPDGDVRRSWLRGHVDAFAGRPIDILLAGDGASIQAYVLGAVQPHLASENMPSY
jgi:hypothetical protein